MASDNKNKNRETVADVVAQMRGRGEDGRMDMSLWRDYADRIEDAAKWHTPGNMAAMREALVAVKKSIDGIGKSSLDCDPTILMASLTQVCARLSARIEQALSAPARNCDRFENAPSAYADFIVPWKLDGHLDDVPTLQDFANWLFTPAAERKGESDENN